MQLSLELVETPAPVAHLWERLPLEQQETVVAALALLIAKTVIQAEEGNHE